MTAHQDDIIDQASQPGNHGHHDRVEIPKAPDFLELLLQSMVERVKVALIKDIEEMINKAMNEVDAEDVQGLEKFIDRCFEDHNRNINIDADDVEGLNDFIKETLKSASISIEI